MTNKRDSITSRPHSVFNVVLVDDPKILGEKALLFVHNISDEETFKTRKTSPSLAEIIPTEKVGGHNKPAGWGCAGGGVKDYERPRDAAPTELTEETGLIALSVTEILELHKFIPVDKRTDDVGGRTIVLPKGQRPYQGWDTRKTNMVENVVHVFHAKIDWLGSPLREIFRRAKAAWRAGGVNGGKIQRDGIFFFFGQLEPETLKLLGIDEVGFEEIDGLALVPVSRILECNPRHGLYISTEEPDDEKEYKDLSPETRVHLLYKSHLAYAKTALTKLGSAAHAA